jgi:DNA-binding IclR family transcriptional regulator
MKPHVPDYPVPALDKGLEILEALSASSTPQTLSALAQLLKRKNNEIFRMVNLLERRRYVLRDESGGYRLSLRMYQLAHAQPMVAQLVEVAMPALRELSLATGESCHLSVLEGMEIVILARIESSNPVRLVVELGGRFSALTTVSGRMILSQKDPGVRQEMLESAPEFRLLKPSARQALMERIEGIAQEGFSAARDETVTGVVDAAVAISGSSSGIDAAVAIAALTTDSGRRDPREFRGPLEKCAKTLRDRLGIP